MFRILSALVNQWPVFCTCRDRYLRCKQSEGNNYLQILVQVLENKTVFRAGQIKDKKQWQDEDHLHVMKECRRCKSEHALHLFCVCICCLKYRHGVYTRASKFVSFVWTQWRNEDCFCLIVKLHLQQIAYNLTFRIRPYVQWKCYSLNQGSSIPFSLSTGKHQSSQSVMH